MRSDKVVSGREREIFIERQQRPGEGIWRLVLQMYTFEPSMSLYLQRGSRCRPDKTVLSMLCYQIIHLLQFYQLKRKPYLKLRALPNGKLEVAQTAFTSYNSAMPY